MHQNSSIPISHHCGHWARSSRSHDGAELCPWPFNEFCVLPVAFIIIMNHDSKPLLRRTFTVLILSAHPIPTDHAASKHGTYSTTRPSSRLSIAISSTRPPNSKPLAGAAPPSRIRQLIELCLMRYEVSAKGYLGPGEGCRCWPPTHMHTDCATSEDLSQASQLGRADTPQCIEWSALVHITIA